MNSNTQINMSFRIRSFTELKKDNLISKLKETAKRYCRNDSLGLPFYNLVDYSSFDGTFFNGRLDLLLVVDGKPLALEAAQALERLLVYFGITARNEILKPYPYKI